MKSNPDNHAHGEFTAPGEVRIVRLLPGPIERVWEFLTNPEKRARWLCGGVMEQKAGGKVEFAMHHKNIAPDETPPAKWAHVQDPGVTFEGRVLRCEPPRLLVFTFGSDDSVATFELSTQGKQVLLTLTHRTTGEEEIAELTNYASGWHSHLNLLIALLEGAPRPPFWATHMKLLAEYEKLRPSTKAV
ncbi:MAG: SRPBCC family protein [Nibricoccus sp.]